jgi:signal peptidase
VGVKVMKDNSEAIVMDELDVEQTKSQRVVEVISDVLFYLLLVAILAAAVMFASSKAPGKSIFGYRYYDVLTGSMEPSYSVGDLILVKVTGAENISVGDPITFNPGSTDDSYLTHRVVEKIENYQETGVTCFRTKGDANESEDPFIIDESRVIGVVKLHIPFFGYVVKFVQYHYIMIIIFIVLFSVFFTLLKKLTSLSAEINALEAMEAKESEEGTNDKVNEELIDSKATEN